MKEITIEIKDVYGKQMFYPMCEAAKVFAALAGTRSLTEGTIRKIIKLGYKINTVQRATNFIEGEMK
jgi:hypothetical protein